MKAILLIIYYLIILICIVKQFLIISIWSLSVLTILKDLKTSLKIYKEWKKGIIINVPG